MTTRTSFSASQREEPKEPHSSFEVQQFRAATQELESQLSHLKNHVEQLSESVLSLQEALRLQAADAAAALTELRLVLAQERFAHAKRAREGAAQ